MKQYPKYNAIDMAPVEIRIRLIRAEVSQSDIARRLEVHPSLVCRVIDGLIVSDRVRRAIAEAIQTDVKAMWPSTYLYSQQKNKKTAVNF